MREKQYSITFDRLKVGATFFRNGNRWLKRSTRTKEIIEPKQYKGQWFYSGMNDQCIINESQIKTDVKG